jgi:hypothetical protein
MTKRSPFLIFFLAFVSAIFIGILIVVYIATRQANPVMLDDKGRPQPNASGAGPWPARGSQPRRGISRFATLSA